MRMRIGYITYGLDRQPTGIGRYSLELVQALANLEDSPEIVLLTTESSDPNRLWTRFEHHTLPVCRLLPGLLSAGNGWLSLAARRYKLDVLHDPNGVAPFLGPALGAKRLVTIHDTFTYVYPQTHNRLDNWRYRWMLPTAAARSDLILTQSENSRRDIARYLAVPDERIEAVAIAAGPQFGPVEDNSERRAVLERYGVEEPYLLYVGGLNARKNIARLLEAFAAVQGQFPTVKLVINGKRQWQLAEMDAAFQRLNLAERVHFTGYVADQDLPSLYSGARALVFPSLYEGFGLPPLEAMACGTPVICSNASSLPEVTGEAALLVDPYDVAALTKAIIRVLSDEQLREGLRAKGLEQAARFSWEQTARKTLTAYRRVIERDGDRGEGDRRQG